ncbi:MAG: hypothetical protein HGB05_08360 [Chloroflexi bacterium]|nr:hypothetical protein [Chloroflexota bacterium]
MNGVANQIKVYGLTGFSLFTLTGNDNPLPVELAAFSATVKKRDVILAWETKTEINVSRFTLERASGDDWKEVASVPAHGNSNRLHRRCCRLHCPGNILLEHLLIRPVSTPAAALNVTADDRRQFAVLGVHQAGVVLQAVLGVRDEDALFVQQVGVSRLPVDAGGQQIGGAIEVETVKSVSQGYLASLWNHEAFQKPLKDGVALLNTIQDVYLDPSVTIA